MSYEIEDEIMRTCDHAMRMWDSHSQVLFCVDCGVHLPLLPRGWGNTNRRYDESTPAPTTSNGEDPDA